MGKACGALAGLSVRGACARAYHEFRQLTQRTCAHPHAGYMWRSTRVPRCIAPRRAAPTPLPPACDAPLDDVELVTGVALTDDHAARRVVLLLKGVHQLELGLGRAAQFKGLPGTRAWGR